MNLSWRDSLVHQSQEPVDPITIGLDVCTVIVYLASSGCHELSKPGKSDKEKRTKATDFHEEREGKSIYLESLVRLVM